MDRLGALETFLLVNSEHSESNYRVLERICRVFAENPCTGILGPVSFSNDRGSPFDTTK